MPIEQLLLIFLRENGINAAPMAPADPQEIQGEYVSVSRVANTTDFRTGLASTTMALDCFIPNPETNGGDRFQAYGLANSVSNLIYPFIRETPRVRTLQDMSISDSSDSRFTYYTIMITLYHHTT